MKRQIKVKKALEYVYKSKWIKILRRYVIDIFNQQNPEPPTNPLSHVRIHIHEIIFIHTNQISREKDMKFTCSLIVQISLAF